MKFARITFGCTVFEGYGQTEFVAAVTMTSPGEVTGGMLYIYGFNLYNDAYCTMA